MQKKKMSYSKGGSTPRKGTVSKPGKRRTVKVVTKNPRPGSVGGTPTTTKTVTKRKKSGKTVTKTKTVRNPMNPFAKSRVSKTKTVTTGSGPMREVVSKKRTTKNVSQKKGNRMQSRMQKRKGAITTTPRGKRMRRA